jgi:hypothetical protein
MENLMSVINGKSGRTALYFIAAALIATPVWSEMGSDSRHRNSPLVENLVIPTQKEFEGILAEAQSHGMRACYRRLYPKGNPYVAGHYDLSAQGQLAGGLCSALYVEGSDAVYQAAPEGKIPEALKYMDEDPAVRLAKVLPKIQKEIHPPRSVFERAGAISACEKKGLRGLYSYLGAKEEDIRDFPDTWLELQEVKKACTKEVKEIERAGR